jgi:hypothetical protein
MKDVLRQASLQFGYGRAWVGFLEMARIAERLLLRLLALLGASVVPSKDCHSHRAFPWRPSFGVSLGYRHAFLRIAVVSGWMGRVWEWATAPLPIEHDVSEANSFLGGSGGRFCPPFCCVAAELSTGIFRAR